MSLLSPSGRALPWYLIVGGVVALLGQGVAVSGSQGVLTTFGAVLGFVGWAAFFVGLIALGTATGMRAASRREIDRDDDGPRRTAEQAES